MAWVPMSLCICSSSRSETHRAAPVACCPLHLARLRLEPEADQTLAFEGFSTDPRPSLERSDHCLLPPVQGSSLLSMLLTARAARRSSWPGIHRGLRFVGIGSLSIVKLAGRDCESVRGMITRGKKVGFTYETLPRACGGSRGGPAWRCV